jgi:hypothetical protein
MKTPQKIGNMCLGVAGFELGVERFRVRSCVLGVDGWTPNPPLHLKMDSEVP